MAIAFGTNVMKNIMEDALKSCAKKTGLQDREQVLEALRQGDCSVCERLRYNLGKGMAEYLSSVDDTIKAVYTYEPEYAIGAESMDSVWPHGAPGIHLVAWVNRKSAALSSVVASLNMALAEEFKRLSCVEAHGPCYELDVKVTDDGEVQRRTGYGALINSLYVRPIEVWHR